MRDAPHRPPGHTEAGGSARALGEGSDTAVGVWQTAALAFFAGGSRSYQPALERIRVVAGLHFEMLGEAASPSAAANRTMASRYACKPGPASPRRLVLTRKVCGNVVSALYISAPHRLEAHFGLRRPLVQPSNVLARRLAPSCNRAHREVSRIVDDTVQTRGGTPATGLVAGQVR